MVKNLAMNLRRNFTKNKLFHGYFSRAFLNKNFIKAKAVAWRRSVKNVFLKISQNSQENTGAEVSFKKSPENFTKLFKNTYLLEGRLLEQLYY